MRVNLFRPSATWIANLAVGDLAPDCFGHLSRVVEIHHKGPDVAGVPFVHVSLHFGPGSTITHAYKAGELVRTVASSDRYTSAALDEIEPTLPESDEISPVEWDIRAE